MWNTIWLILGLLGYYTPLGAFAGGVKISLSLENVLRGVFLHGQFEPFWFMLQLIIMTAFCPVIYLLVKNKWVGIVAITAFYILYCFGFRFQQPLVPDTSMVIYYLIGAWVGVHYFDLFTGKRGKKPAAAGLAIFIICCLFRIMRSSLPAWIPFEEVLPVLTVISCIAFWVCMDFFAFERCPAFLNESFAIYAMHSLIGAMLARAIAMLLPAGNGYLVLNAVLSFPATVAIICAFSITLKKHAPGVSKILFGRM